MGEKIKDLAKGKVFNEYFEIELNHPPANNMNQTIHFQSKKIRLELSKEDYIKLAFILLVAEKNLKNLKKIK